LSQALAATRQANRDRVLAQVGQLRTADAQAVPSILENLAPGREEILPRLRELWAEGGDRQQRMRVGLALLPAEPQTVQPALMRWLLEAEDPREVEVVRDVLAPWSDQLKGDLWEKVNAEATPAELRLRALAALARFDPDNPNWHRTGATVVAPWLRSDPLYLGIWARTLYPARQHLLAPLTEVFHGRVAKLTDKREEAASILARYFKEEPEKLAELLADADDRQFGVLFPVLRAHNERAVALLSKELDRTSAPVQRQANAAIALLLLNQAERIWPLFQHRPDPSLRTCLVNRAAPLGVAARLLVERLEKEPNVSARRALILSLGEFTAEQLPLELRQRILPRLLRWYAEDPDPGIHGAIDWLLRHGREGREPRKLDWGKAEALRRIDQEVQGRKPPDGRRWLVNSQGQTLTLIPGPVEFLMGSPASEPGRLDTELQHRCRIGRSFAIASKPVTVAQFQAFLKANSGIHHNYPQQYSPEPDGPIITVTWYDVVQYCRWLSEQEGIPEDQMCYPSIEEIEKCKDAKMQLKMPPGYLKRTGYRLPTEAEWEYVCRAGAETAWSFGRSGEVLRHYAWYLSNSSDRSWPVGQKKPNDLGMFDMQGNVWNWCHNGWERYQPGKQDEAVEDEEDKRDVEEGIYRGNFGRVVRGGSFIDNSGLLRCASRLFARPQVLSNSVDLRSTC
jgi:formylglycine-generating enzyme required for sulfatase activity